MISNFTQTKRTKAAGKSRAVLRQAWVENKLVAFYGFCRTFEQFGKGWACNIWCSHCCDQTPNRATSRRKDYFSSWFKNKVYCGGEGLRPVAGGSWSHATTVRKQRWKQASSQFAFSILKKNLIFTFYVWLFTCMLACASHIYTACRGQMSVGSTETGVRRKFWTAIWMQGT